MKPILFACIAVILYAIQNVVMEQKLAKLSTVSILLFSYPIMLMLAVAWVGQHQIVNLPITWPSGSMWIIIVVGGTLWFLADGFYLGAYTSGGKLMTVTTIVIMFPIVAAAIKQIFIGHQPNAWHVAGWAVAVIAVLLVTKGELVSRQQTNPESKTVQATRVES